MHFVSKTCYYIGYPCSKYITVLLMINAVGPLISYVLMFFRTFRQECEAHIALKVDDEGKALQVRSLCNEHNHELSKVCS